MVGAAAQRVLSDSKRMLQRLIEGRWLQAHGVFALLPANTVDDETIDVYADEPRLQVLLRWSPLRIQTERPVVDGVKRPNRCLADFIAPRVGPGARTDYLGLFGDGMSQVTLYLDPETDALLTQSAARSGLSKSRWVVRLIRKHACEDWPPDRASRSADRGHGAAPRCRAGDP